MISHDDFYERLKNQILSASNFSIGQEIIIMGDLNTDMQKHDTSIYKQFNLFWESYALKQIIVDPTSIMHKTKTVFDIVLVSDKSKVCRSGVLDAGISDHCIVYVIRKSRREAIRQHNTVKFRSLKKIHFLQKNLVRLTGLKCCSVMRRIWPGIGFG